MSGHVPSAKYLELAFEIGMKACTKLNDDHECGINESSKFQGNLNVVVGCCSW